MMARSLLLAFLAILLAGCGSSGSGGSGGSDSSPGFGLYEVQGRAQTHVPLEGATLQILDLEGRPLVLAVGAADIVEAPGQLAESTTTGVNGQFRFTAMLPESFRVVVTPSQSAKVSAASEVSPLVAEVRHFRGERYLGVNFVTNLVSVYMREHPGLSLEEAEGRVRTYLAIPEGIDLGTGLDADQGAFSRSVFARRAGQNGGIASFTRSLADQVDVGPPSPIVAGAEAPTSPLSGFVGDVAKGLVSDGVKAGIEDGFGWAVGLAGFNIGGVSNKEIEEQLDAIQQELNEIELEIAQQTLTLEYSQDQAALEPLVSNITNTSQQVATLASQYPPGFGAPVSSAMDQPLINQLQGQNPPWDSLANEILDYLLGRASAPNNMVALYKSITMGMVQADSPAAYVGYPLRSNGLLAQLQGQCNYYLQVVNEALNLLAETNHLVYRDLEGNFTSNAVPIMLAKTSMLNILAASRQAWEQLPEPLASDNVLVDMENGITWYLVVGEPVPYYPNVYQGSPIVTGPYGSASVNGRQFMLPTQQQLDSLRHRLQAINPSSPTQALTTLGFTGLAAGTTNLEVWTYSSSFASYYCSTGFAQYVYTYYMNSGDTKKASPCDPGTKHNYLLVLPFPGPAEQSASNPLLANGLPGTMTVQTISPTQLRCTATNSTISSGGTFTVGTQSHSAPASHVTRASDDISANVVWTSSNLRVADISNLDRTTNQQGQLVTQPGQITWHPDAPGGLVPVTFTAAYGSNSASLTVAPPSPAPTAQLVSIQVMPTNLLYSYPPRNEYYHATGFYDDETAVNLDTLVTWSVVSTTDGSPIPPSQAGFITSVPNLLILSNTLATSQLTVQATYQGVTGSAVIEVPVLQNGLRHGAAP